MNPHPVPSFMAAIGRAVQILAVVLPPLPQSHPGPYLGEYKLCIDELIMSISIVKHTFTLKVEEEEERSLSSVRDGWIASPI